MFGSATSAAIVFVRQVLQSCARAAVSPVNWVSRSALGEQDPFV
jgi:hypothetical protein